jgi:hypothetical protein
MTQHYQHQKSGHNNLGSKFSVVMTKKELSIHNIAQGIQGALTKTQSTDLDYKHASSVSVA